MNAASAQERAPEARAPRPDVARWLGLALLALSLALPLAGAELPLPWRWSNPRPHGGNVVDMAYSPLLDVTIQVAELGQIYSSFDLNLWIPRVSGTTADLRAVSFLGARVLITGSSGTVLYADDLSAFHAGVLTSGPTADWLEGVTASPQLAVAVGDTGAIYTSTNGVHWRRQSSGTSQWLRGVTWGGGVFVAVGENGKIFTSANGTNWASRASGTSQHFNRVSYAAGRFSAVAEFGECRSSTNGGLNWFVETTGATNDLFAGTQMSGVRLVAGDYEVHSQEGANAWVDELSGTFAKPTPWTYYTAVRSSNSFLIAGRTGLMEEGHLSTNGAPLYWTHGDESFRPWLWDVAFTIGPYIAVGDHASVLTSGNGADWKLEVVPPAVTNAVFLGVGGTSNMLITVGNAGSIIISPNVVTNEYSTNQSGIVSVTSGSAFGVLWYALPPLGTSDLQGVAASSNLFVVTGGGGAIWTSPDATNWTRQASPTTKFLSSVTAWPGGWCASGDDGVMVASADGSKWNLVPMATTNWLYRIRYCGGRLVTVGQNGTIFTSASGASWLPRVSGTTKWLNDLAFIGDTWFVLGNSGTVLTSTNSTNWSATGTITRKNLYGAATDGRQLVTAGIEGAILRAQVLPDPTPLRILAFDHVATNSIYQNLYLFGGKPDQRFTLDFRTGLETNDWVTGPLLEFIDGSGTLFYLETLRGTNLPPQEFYRGTLVD
jgi:hypothetical protein